MAKPDLENGHTRIANEIVEALARVNLTSHESRVLWCILRHTYGWNKKSDRISYSQFQEYTGIDRRHVGRSLASLKARRIILCRGEGYALEYGLQKNYELWGEFATISGNDIDTKQGNDLPPFEATNSTDNTENLPPSQDNLPPSQDALPPFEATNLPPSQGTTKAIKHITKAYNKSICEIPEWIDKDKWKAFLEMRKVIKQPPTDYAIRLLIGKLERLRDDGNDPSEVLTESIMNNWKGLFPLKDGKNNGAHKKDTPRSQPAKYTMPDEL